MKVSLLLLSLILSIQIVGQSIDKAVQLLKNKNLDSLKEFVDKSKGMYVQLEIFRDVIPNYQEGVLNIHEPKNLIQCSSKINFLSTGQTIFYYSFEKGCINYSLGESRGFDFLRDSFTNKEEYSKFEKTFFDAYGASIDKADMFRTSIVFGGACGIAGTPPEFQEKLDSLIKIRDITSIRTWLRSPNSEKQLYAIQGLIELERKLYYISPTDKKIIDIIRQKQGKVNVCYGCIHTREEMKEVLLDFDNSLRTHKRTRNDILFAIFYGSIAILLLIFSKKKFDQTKTIA